MYMYMYVGRDNLRRIRSLSHLPNPLAIPSEQVNCKNVGFSCIGTMLSNGMVSCDSQGAIPKLIASIVLRVVTNVWRMFVYSLVTNSLQLPASSIQFCGFGVDSVHNS